MGSRDHLTGGLGLAGEAASVVAAFLSTLEASLPLPAGERARILAEVADGLSSAIAGEIEAGLAPAEAARAVVADFGEPGELADQFVAALAPRPCR